MFDLTLTIGKWSPSPAHIGWPSAVSPGWNPNCFASFPPAACPIILPPGGVEDASRKHAFATIALRAC